MWVALLGASLTSLEAQKSSNVKLVSQKKHSVPKWLSAYSLFSLNKLHLSTACRSSVSRTHVWLVALAKQATPDGTTILQAVSASMSLLPNVYDSIEYDPINDFTPLALLGTTLMLLL
ncbi:hypothetical protein GM154_15150 [Pseudomonas sp. MAG002Y]|nr:hypothetical protein [Pseudomonas sp. MAG002Y]